MHAHTHNSIRHNNSAVRFTKQNKTSKQVSITDVSIWLTAFRSQQLLVTLTAACCVFKKQVQFGVKEIVNFVHMYVALFSKLVFSYKTRENYSAVIACLLRAQQDHHNTFSPSISNSITKILSPFFILLSLHTVRSLHCILFCSTQYLQLNK